MKSDEDFFTIEEFLQKQLRQLEDTVISRPRLTANWIYIKGKVPETVQNAQLVTLAEVLIADLYEIQLQRKKKIDEMKDPFDALTEE